MGTMSKTEATQVEKEVEGSLANFEPVNEAPVSDWLGTGSTMLDVAIAGNFPGGFPVGRMVHVFGMPSTGKSIECQEALGSAQRKGGTAVYVDVERTLDLERAKSVFGLNTEKDFYLYHPSTLEEFFDEVVGKVVEDVEKGKISTPVAMAVDSTTSLPCIAQLDADLKDPTFGTLRAKIIGDGIRKWLERVSKAKITMIMIDQSRDKIGAPVKQETTSGGNAVPFYSSVRVQLFHKGEIQNVNKIAMGVNLAFKVVKNKIAPPFRKGPMRVLFEYGIDDIGTNLEWLKEQGKLGSTTGPWYDLGGGRKAQGLDKAIALVEENNLEMAVANTVWQCWKKLGEVPARKARVRFL